ncbi:hypothetical protein ACFRKB_02235 [Streptomyces scopuliridis]|uniref:hypothetical protein n=1 Tax=Streptomyces scopuliridis TaxID=452529 RepID=UPI0036B735A7
MPGQAASPELPELPELADRVGHRALVPPSGEGGLFDVLWRGSCLRGCSGR